MSQDEEFDVYVEIGGEAVVLPPDLPSESQRASSLASRVHRVEGRYSRGDELVGDGGHRQAAAARQLAPGCPRGIDTPPERPEGHHPSQARHWSQGHHPARGTAIFILRDQSWSSPVTSSPPPSPPRGGPGEPARPDRGRRGAGRRPCPGWGILCLFAMVAIYLVLLMRLARTQHRRALVGTTDVARPVDAPRRRRTRLHREAELPLGGTQPPHADVEPSPGKRLAQLARPPTLAQE
jgi:hypothetical protein